MVGNVQWGVFRLRGLGRRKTYLARKLPDGTWSVVERRTTGKTFRRTQQLNVKLKAEDNQDCAMSQHFITEDQFKKYYEPVDAAARSMVALA